MLYQRVTTRVYPYGWIKILFASVGAIPCACPLDGGDVMDWWVTTRVTPTGMTDFYI